MSLGLAAARAEGQIPFLTDDSAVTPKGHWNFQFFSEYAVLPRSALPDRWQETNNFVIQFGATRNLELNIDFPIILINRESGAPLPDAFGFGDIDFAAKYKFFDQDPAGWRPAFAMSAAVEVPSGDSATQLGSGFTDFVLNTIGQKQMSEAIDLIVNLGYQNNGNTLTGAIGIRTPGHILSAGASVHVNVSERLLLGLDLNGARVWTSGMNAQQIQLTLGGIWTLGPTTSLNFAAFTGWYSSPRAGVLVGFTYSP